MFYSCFHDKRHKRYEITASRVVQNVGFIGLGNMGRGMAKNLLDKGHAVVAFDTDSVTLKETVALGAKEAASPKVKFI